MEETYSKVKGEWRYLYRAVDKEGNTIDFLVTKRRNKFAAHKFLLKAIKENSCPKVINMDKVEPTRKRLKLTTNDALRKS